MYLCTYVCICVCIYHLCMYACIYLRTYIRKGSVFHHDPPNKKSYRPKIPPPPPRNLLTQHGFLRSRPNLIAKPTRFSKPTFKNPRRNLHTFINTKQNLSFKGSPIEKGLGAPALTAPEGEGLKLPSSVEVEVTTVVEGLGVFRGLRLQGGVVA